MVNKNIEKKISNALIFGLILGAIIGFCIAFISFASYAEGVAEGGFSANTSTARYLLRCYEEPKCEGYYIENCEKDTIDFIAESFEYCANKQNKTSDYIMKEYAIIKLNRTLHEK